jgi:hypothetical protein
MLLMRLRRTRQVIARMTQQWKASMLRATAGRCSFHPGLSSMQKPFNQRVSALAAAAVLATAAAISATASRAMSRYVMTQAAVVVM